MKKFHMLIIVPGVLIVVNFGLLFGVVRSVHKGKTLSNRYAKFKTYKEGLSPFIVGGRELNIDEHPYIAYIMIKADSMSDMNDNINLCFGVIISTNWVVTAGHCYWEIIKKNLTRDDIFIHSNTVDYTTGNKRDVKKWAIHKHFNKETLKHDIALMMVAKPFDGEYEKPIPVASRKYFYKPQRLVTLIGWGAEHEGGQIGPQTLRGVVVQIIDFNECQEIYHNTTHLNGSFYLYRMTFCAWCDMRDADECLIESGGLIFDRNLAIGIVSFGERCAQNRTPGVYVKLGVYSQWMISTTKRLKSPAKIIFKDHIDDDGDYIGKY